MTLTTSSHSTRVRSADTRRRVGFTLIELLVVIAIIAVLAALTGAAIQMTMVRQRNLNTKGDVNKLQQSLDVEYSRVVKQCADDRVATPCRIPQAIRTYCGDDNRAQAIWTAMNLYRQFPQSFAEINSQPNVGGYQLSPLTTFANVALLPSGQLSPTDESGVLLFIILTQKSVAGGGAMATAGDDLSLQKLVTVTTAGGTTTLPTFKDAFGNSIGFNRWDTGSPFPGSPSPMNPKNLDPLDTRNLVLGWSNPIPVSLGFNGKYRVPNVYSPGNPNAKPPTPVYGYQAKQYGN